MPPRPDAAPSTPPPAVRPAAGAPKAIAAWLGVVTVAVVDDHPTTRAGTRAVLTDAGLSVVAEAATVAETHRLLALDPPQVLVLDLNLADGNALHHLTEYGDLAPATRVLVHSMHDEIPVVRAALGAGAAGYLSKLAPTSQLVAAVTTLAAGGHYLPADLAQRLARPSTVTAHGPLSDREQDALRLWAAGRTHSDVAAHLGLSVRSVERLRAALATRLALTTRAQIAAYVSQHLR